MNIANQVTEKPKQTIDRFGRAYATGRRKTATARVWIKLGTGKIVINNKNIDKPLSHKRYKNEILKPFVVLKCEDRFDIICTVSGGGLSGQAGAIKHGVSRALDIFNPDYHSTLSSSKLLTRDNRMVESKKYGKHKARRGTQFAKR
ncbi:30S ribosomal subunit protein S9 [Candidatus Xenohaliotis californiensis]|uniref:Small ribosomal subunit protein uS9 n=1 Tax=Candidatus Xenohaliotis californiensis TaxID=84677 RepID=A0ABM9N7S7_9RICK|nr:30S ribosomal subunit protein S9 [Candidatus Xenohaliotis californiensis]